MDSLRGLVGAVRRRPKTGLLVVAVCLSAAASASADPFGRASASRDLNVERGDRGAAVERAACARGASDRRRLRPCHRAGGPALPAPSRARRRRDRRPSHAPCPRARYRRPRGARRGQPPSTSLAADRRMRVRRQSSGRLGRRPVPRQVSVHPGHVACPRRSGRSRGCPGVAAGSPGAEALSAQRRCSWPACA